MKKIDVLLALLVVASGCATGATELRKSDADPVVLGGYSARFRAGEAQRNHNIARAAASLDGVVIKPGATMSFNRTVGQRTGKRGYVVAPTLTLEGTEPALGGGVCQVSSVLFNALMLADLELTERHPHSRPIRYIPPGRDATVSFGHLDLVVRNKHPFPVTIHAEVRGSRLNVFVTAPEPLPYEVALVTEQIEEASAKRPLEIVGVVPPAPDAVRIHGVYVKLYRLRLYDGVAQARERLASTLYMTGIDRGAAVGAR